MVSVKGEMGNVNLLSRGGVDCKADFNLGGGGMGNLHIQLKRGAIILINKNIHLFL